MTVIINDFEVVTPEPPRAEDESAGPQVVTEGQISQVLPTSADISQVVRHFDERARRVRAH